ncbi:MAG TPA: sigma factor [Ktedonobacteraceae bacterium]
MQQRPVLQDEDGDTPAKKRHACAARLYQLYAPALFEYIMRHTGALHDAEDILTDVFIGALRADLTVMSADKQRAWL